MMTNNKNRLPKLASLILCMCVCLMVSGKALAWDGALKEWMKYLPDSVQLSQINMPGTHDSATFAITFWSTTWAQCHDDNIREQLDHGIRVFDLRLRTKKADPTNIFAMELNHGGWTCWHSAISYEQVRLGYIMDEVSDFLKAHPTETVVLIVTDECQGDPARKQQVKDNLSRLQQMYPPFKDHPGQKYGDMFYYFDDGDYVPTLGQVRGKCVIVDDYGTMTSYENNWSSYASDKIKFIKNAVQTAGAQNWSGLITDRFISENYENPDNPGEPNVKIFFTSSNAGFLEGPRKASQKTNPEFEKLTLKNGARYGWVLMDFPTEKMIKKVIGSNQNTVQLYFHGGDPEMIKSNSEAIWQLYRYNSTHPAEMVLDESSGIKWFLDGWRAEGYYADASIKIDNMPQFDENGELWQYRLQHRFVWAANPEWKTYYYSRNDGERKPVSTYSWLNRDVNQIDYSLKGVFESLDNTFTMHIKWEDDNNRFESRPKNVAQFVEMMGGVTLTEIDPTGFAFTKLVDDVTGGTTLHPLAYLDYDGQDTVTVRNLTKQNWGKPVTYEANGFHNIAADSPYFFTGSRKIAENEYEVTLRHRQLADTKKLSGTIYFHAYDGLRSEYLVADMYDYLYHTECITIVDYYNGKVFDVYNVKMDPDVRTAKDGTNGKTWFRHTKYTLTARDYGSEHTQMIVFPTNYDDKMQVISTSVDGSVVHYSQLMELDLWLNMQPWYGSTSAKALYENEYPYGYNVVVEYGPNSDELIDLPFSFAVPEDPESTLQPNILVPMYNTNNELMCSIVNLKYASTYSAKNKNQDKNLLWGMREMTAKELNWRRNGYWRDDGRLVVEIGVKVWGGNQIPPECRLPADDYGVDRVPYEINSGFTYGPGKEGLNAHIVDSIDPALSEDEQPYGSSLELRVSVANESELTATEKAALHGAMQEDEDVTAVMDILLFKYFLYERTQMHETPSGKLSIQVDVPEEYRGRSDLNFDIIRIHNGQADRLGCEYDRRNETLTFQSDRFSVFVITASKAQDVTGPVNITVSWENVGHASKPVPGSVNAILNNDEGFERKFPLEKSSSWKYTFQDMLLAHSVNGQLYPVSYTLRADAVDGFTQAISGDAEHGFVITYTAIPPIPVTGDDTNMPLLVAMLVMSMGVLCMLLRKRKAA